MGIPFYFKKLTNEFENIIIDTLPSDRSCSRLFLDFNGGIHHCSSELKKSLNENNVTLNELDFETKLIKEVCNYLEYLCNYVNPSELLYISVDGIAPMAKIAQQRKRRYFNDWKKKQVLEKLDVNSNEYDILLNEWNSNAITPGTSFMYKLMKNIEVFIMELEKKMNINIILSSCFEKGEGEHKIFNYIHQNLYHDINNNEYTDVIYGLDADLILLSMLSKNINNTYLLREPTNFKRDKSPERFLYLDVSCVKKQLVNQFANKLGITNYNKDNEQNFIKNYVFLTFLLGNDFLPNLSYLKLQNDGLEMLLDVYKSVFEELQTSDMNHDNEVHIINMDNDINWIFFYKLIEELSSTEDENFVTAEYEYYENTKLKLHSFMKANKSESILELKKIEYLPVTQKFPKVIQSNISSGWRSNYYYHLFEKNINSDIINRVCRMYINGLKWTCDYYFNRKTNWSWYYKFSYSPTILDIYNYLNMNFIQTKTIDDIYENSVVDDDVPSTNIEQLLMVLPPSSINLIPIDFRKYVHDVSLGQTHNFPTSFKINTFMKKLLHECNSESLHLREQIHL